MKKIIATITYKYEIQVDQDGSIVKEYEGDSELINDLASYRFLPVLPVLQSNQVKVMDVEVIDIKDIKIIKEQTHTT